MAVRDRNLDGRGRRGGGGRDLRRAIRNAEVEWITIAPIAFIFAYPLGALVFVDAARRSWWFPVLFLVTAIVEAVHAWAPWRQRGQLPSGLAAE